MKLLRRLLHKLGAFFVDYERIGLYGSGAVEGIRMRQVTDLERQVQALATELRHLTSHFKLPTPKFEEIQYRVYSQNGEDGILRYLFDRIGAVNKRAIEICAGDGQENNTANLIIHHGWSALLFDGNPKKVAEGQKFFKMNPATTLFPPKFVHAWITAENINDLIKENGYHGEIDLLSIDLDGLDYWIWEAIDTVSPRVVVIEYNQIWPEDKSVTVPNDPNFQTEFNGFVTDYAGASLAAMVSLGKRLGYRLIGVEAKQFNAFFVRNDIAPDLFPEIEVAKGLDSDFVKKTRLERMKNIQDRPWVQV